MKKLIMTVAVLATASIVTAQTVTSANIVGYNKETTADADYTMAGMHFSISAGNAVPGVLGDTMPIGSKAYLWDGVGGYTIPEYTYLVSYSGFPPAPTTNGIGWTVNGETETTTTISSGEGFWLVAPDGTVGANEAILAGEVEIADSVTNTVVSGLNMLASPYPAEVSITNMGFNSSATIGDKIYLWDGVGGYAIPEYTYLVSYSGFPPAPTTNGVNWTVDGENATGEFVSVGEGFWYYSENASDVDWVMTRPFTP